MRIQLTLLVFVVNKEILKMSPKKELKKVKQLSIIKKFKGTWKDADHPELTGKEGTYKWVRKLRDEDEKMLRKKLA